MKTGNFPGKVNARRQGVLDRLKARIDNKVKVYAENKEKIEKLLKIANDKKAAGILAKTAKEDAQVYIDANKAILEEIAPYNKQINTLEKKITTEDVARSRRTKKSREGQMRRNRNS